MRWFYTILILLIVSFKPFSSPAQLNKNYFYWLAQTMLYEDNYRGAIEALNVLMRVDDKAHEAYFMRGIAKYNLDDLLGAEYDFSRAIDINPVYTRAYHYRAITRTMLGNYDDALRDFQEAINLRPDLPGPYFSRGVTFLLSEKFTEAIADFDQYIRYENKVADAYINRGTAYLYVGDTIRAYQEYDTAIRTNRNYPESYNRRGALLRTQERYEEALADFDKAIQCDSNYMRAYYQRALLYADTDRPVEALEDLSKVIDLDPTYSLAYFNRAVIRSQIGDYNKALEDYNTVVLYNPNNVLVYYYRALLHGYLGYFNESLNDYTKAIELYPDFANAYLGRSRIKYFLRDIDGAERDRRAADVKIAEYRSRLDDDENFAMFADTSRVFNRLIEFDSDFARSDFGHGSSEEDNITLLSPYRFIFTGPDETLALDPNRYYVDKLELFKRQLVEENLEFTSRTSDLSADSLAIIDAGFDAQMRLIPADWLMLFKRGVSQTHIKQYTNALNFYTEAIERNPDNPFLYINRSVTRSEMIDFISSIDNSYQRLAVDIDPVSQLKSTGNRTYNYDEAIADLNRAARLFPDFAYTYYNRGNLYAHSGMLPEALEDYTRAIELDPNFAEAYFNRGLVQIYLKDTRKGLLDVSKAGELGIPQAYTVLRRYSRVD